LSNYNQFLRFWQGSRKKHAPYPLEADHEQKQANGSQYRRQFLHDGKKKFVNVMSPYAGVKGGYMEPSLPKISFPTLDVLAYN
jgi:hypothetical protein